MAVSRGTPMSPPPVPSTSKGTLLGSPGDRHWGLWGCWPAGRCPCDCREGKHVKRQDAAQSQRGAGPPCLEEARGGACPAGLAEGKG